MIEYPDVECTTCAAKSCEPCIDPETGVEVDVHGSRRMVALWRAAVEATLEAVAAQASRAAASMPTPVDPPVTGVDEVSTWSFPPKKGGDA